MASQSEATQSENVFDNTAAQSENARTLRRDIAKTLHSFQCQRPLVLTGETDSALTEFLVKQLHEYITEEQKLNCGNEETRHAIAIGLAMDYLLNTRQPIQFRSGAFFSKKCWARLGQRSVWMAGCAVLLSILIYAAGSFWINQREKEFVHTLESWAVSKDPSLHAELFSVSTDASGLIDQWMRLIEKNAKDYRFLMKAPKVAHFLDWMTRHPLIKSCCANSDPISFEQIRYQLVSYPHLEAMNDPYLVKIDLEFKASSSSHARKFHEMLLQESNHVDSSREIGWEMTGDFYRTSFYLKNESFKEKN
jgi:hypothetical protein